jgi:hypothetical protein
MWVWKIGRRNITVLVATSFMITAVSDAPLAHAQSPRDDARRAEQAADQFLTAFDIEDPSSLYENRMAAAFKYINYKGWFIQNVPVTRTQLGGVGQARTLVGSQALSQMPNGQKGIFFYVRYRTRFPNGDAFQDVYLEKNEGMWLVGFFNFSGAPPVQ